MQFNAKSILMAVFTNNKSNTQTSALQSQMLTEEMAAHVSGGAKDTYTSTAIGSTQGPDWGDWIKR
ncbi:MAG TPA: hypothetical protein DCS87_08300 [Rheinheimera sp.]|nr:hypothetical protein [Rheinheimera sp.]